MTSINWNDTNDYMTQWAETEDPRVLTVITRDEEPLRMDNCGATPFVPLNRHYDYDTPWCGYSVCDQCVAAERAVSLYKNALQHFENSWTFGGDAEEAARRYMKIFHNSQFRSVRDHTDRDGGGVLLFTTQEWVDSLFSGGHEVPPNFVLENFTGEAADWTQYFEGDVWGIGHAINPERSSHDEEVDLSEFEATYDCWGFYGEEYAKEEALGGEYSELDLLVTLEQQMSVHPMLAFSLGRAKSVDEVKQIMAYSEVLKMEDEAGAAE